MPDGKYINVKGYKEKLAFLWAVDYFKHDFPVIMLAPSENYQSWKKFFSYFRNLNYAPQLIVCDDNTSLKMAAREIFPRVSIQACYNHLKENIRRRLRIRSENKYRPFFSALDKALCNERIPEELLGRRLRYAYHIAKNDPVALTEINNLMNQQEELLAYKKYKKAPKTTNLIESFNSHLEGRLKSLKGFNSFENARLWLNGYVLKRRFTKYTDCRKYFKPLNGKFPIELSLRKNVKIPKLF